MLYIDLDYRGEIIRHGPFLCISMDLLNLSCGNGTFPFHEKYKGCIYRIIDLGGVEYE